MLPKLGEILSGLDWAGVAELVAIAIAPVLGKSLLSHLWKFIIGGGLLKAGGSLIGKAFGFGGGLLNGGFDKVANVFSTFGDKMEGVFGTGGTFLKGLGAWAAAGTFGTAVAGKSGTIALQLQGASDEYLEERGDYIAGHFHDMKKLLWDLAPWTEQGKIYNDWKNAERAGDVEAMRELSAALRETAWYKKEYPSDNEEEKATSKTLSEKMAEVAEGVKAQETWQKESAVTATALDGSLNKTSEVYRAVATEANTRGTENTNRLATAFQEGVFDIKATLLEMMAQTGGDLVINVDGEELARASQRGLNKLDKRLNPQVSFA